MCRLFGAMVARPLETDWLEGFRSLADCGLIPAGCEGTGHRDGWGLAAWTPSCRSLYRSTEDASEDDLLIFLRDSLSDGSLPANGIISHLRRASPGNPVRLQHSHPFQTSRYGREWLFAHNGTIRDPEYAYNAVTDRIDSQILLECILDHLSPEDLEDRFADAICQALSRVLMSLQDYTAVCCLISDGAHLAAYRDYSRPNDAGYYTLHYISEPGERFIVCSERLATGRSRWIPMANRECLVAGPDLGPPERRKL